MKKLSFVLYCACSSIIMHAHGKTQDDINIVKPLQPKNEIGLMLHTFLSDRGNNTDMLITGLQYYRHVTQNIGYRALGGYGLYNNFSSNYGNTNSGDTTIEKHAHTSANLFMLGFGVQAQRRFYKKLYLFADFEIRGGYGTGVTDSQLNRSYRSNEQLHKTYQSIGRKEMNMLHIGISPTIGAKIQLRKIVFGLEVYPLNISFNNISGAGITNFDLGNMEQRFFVHYRF